MPDINILVVDDEKEIADLIEFILSAMVIKCLRRRTLQGDWRSLPRRISIWCFWIS